MSPATASLRRGAGGALAVIVLITVGAAGIVEWASSGERAVTGTVVVSATACAQGWVAPQSGQQTFEVENTSSGTIFGVDLVGANETSVYGEIETLAPGTTVPMTVVLPPGRYSFECEAFSGATSYSAPENVVGAPVAGADPYTPAELDQVQNATVAYQTSLVPYLHRLATDTDALAAAVRRDDLGLARSLWLPAHLDYARLGAAYDTFGSFNDKIDGRPQGLVGGVDSPDFRGFLRLEYGLWHDQPTSELIGIAVSLDRAVHGLVAAFPSMVMPMNDLSLRTHEILENALQFELTGETDEGSNTNLATAWANAQGTQLALQALTPLLREVDPGLLRQVGTGLAALTARLASFRHPDGTWTAVRSLGAGQREQLDGVLGSLLEQLSDIPDVLDLPIRPESPND